MARRSSSSPNTQVTIDDLQASASGDKVVEITQAIGRTWHVVTHLTSAKSKYEIRSGASTSAVRGTAFEVVVRPDGTTDTITTEGDVATSAHGTEVHVLPGQFTSVTRRSAPRSPQPAPEPAATVKITVDLTQNAIVTDGNGRAVGVQNGRPVRYVPGSKVEITNGKLVVTIPNAQVGVLSIFITPDAPAFGGNAPTSVNVQTEVSIKDIGIVANSLTSTPFENGTAKAAVVVTDSGLLLVPNSDARNGPAPHIGKAPAGPAGRFPFFNPPTPAPLVTVPTTSGPTISLATLTIEAPQALAVTTAAFIPFHSIATNPATSATGASTPVNTGVIAITTPFDPIFNTPPSATIGDPTTSPFTLPTSAFATPTPAALSPLVNTPPIELKPAAPTPGGFLPRTNLLVPTPPSVIRVAPPIDVVPPTPPAPTFVVAPLPVFIAPTVAPTPAPTLVIAPLPTFIAPTPVPTTFRLRCIPGITC